MPDSSLFCGAKPNEIRSAAWEGVSCQLSSPKSNGPPVPRNSRTGSANASGIPVSPSDGPIPRATTSFVEVPATMNPAIMAPSPTSTRNLVEIFSARVGLADGDGFGLGVAVDSGVGVTAGVGLAVTEGAGVLVGVGTGVIVGLTPGVAVTTGVGVAVTVGVGVRLGLGLAVGVGVAPVETAARKIVP